MLWFTRVETGLVVAGGSAAVLVATPLAAWAAPPPAGPAPGRSPPASGREPGTWLCGCALDRGEQGRRVRRLRV